jgi:PAS domain S-box-containing protein
MRGIRGSLILVGFGAAALYWILDAMIHAVCCDDHDFFVLLLGSAPQEFWPRITVVALIVAFGAISHAYYARSQKALLKNEQKMRSYYMAIPVPTHTWQMRGGELEMVSYNDAMVALTEGGIKNFLGIKLSEMYKDDPNIIEELTRCFNDRITIEREMPYRMRSTGEDKHLAVKSAFVPPDSVMVHTEDITERVRATEERRQVQERWQSLIENSPSTIVIVERDGTIQLINRTTSDFTVSESIGTNAFDYMWPEFRDTARAVIERVFDTGESGEFESYAGREGSAAWYVTNAGPITHDGRVVAAALIATDISERKLAEDALKATHANLELLVEERTLALSTMLEVSSSVASTLDLEISLHRILQGLKRVVPFGGASIHAVQGESLTLQYSLGPVDERPDREPLPFGRFWHSQEIIHRRQTLVVSDIRNNRHGELELVRAVFPDQYCDDIRSLVAVPLVAGRETIGILSVNDVAEGRYDAKHVQLVSAFADLAALALEHDRFYKQSEQLAILSERERLARDLHDAVTQTLFSVTLLADALPRIWERSPEEGRQRLDEMRQMTRGALAEMRTLLLELRPASLADADPEDLLRQLAQSISGRSQLPITVDVEGECLHSPEQKVAIYRIAQEALNNVAKHARASHASVTMQFTPRAAKLCVSDDGRGFNPLAVPPETLGLRIMRERAEAIGAKLTIDSQDGHGTTVTVLWEK